MHVTINGGLVVAFIQYDTHDTIIPKQTAGTFCPMPYRRPFYDSHELRSGGEHPTNTTTRRPRRTGVAHSCHVKSSNMASIMHVFFMYYPVIPGVLIVVLSCRLRFYQ